MSLKNSANRVDVAFMAWDHDRTAPSKCFSGATQVGPVADGDGNSLTAWDANSAGPGFLQDAGYTTRKDGPSNTLRQDILKTVFLGQQEMPDWLSDTVTLQWGAPQSVERFNKIRSTINVGLGTQKGKQNPSLQAIKKWEEDLIYMDNILRKLVN